MIRLSAPRYRRASPAPPRQASVFPALALSKWLKSSTDVRHLLRERIRAEKSRSDDRVQVEPWIAPFLAYLRHRQLSFLSRPVNPTLGFDAAGERQLIREFSAFLAKQPKTVQRHPAVQEPSTKKLRSASDLRQPALWFPRIFPRARKVVLHVGPTNSGKTHHALQAFLRAKTGTYCAPLRLLAHEIWERANTAQVPCRLVTGEEQRKPFSTKNESVMNVDDTLQRADEHAINGTHVACTVEMLNTSDEVEVAVIDEIQMMADPDRGWAWTQALLGARAEEVHLCGEISAVNLVRSICESLGETVEVQTYERLSPLIVSATSLNGIGNIQKGDCVIAFSRRAIFELKKRVESERGLRCAVIYGGLPPETRSEQARLFNEKSSEFDVLVASDAVGMGLNLNIRRIVFSTCQKHNGTEVVPLTVSQVRQIAGRAGRFGTYTDENAAAENVTAFSQADLNYIGECLASSSVDNLSRAGLHFTADILEEFAALLPQQPFSALLSKFEETARLDTRYFLTDMDHFKFLADTIHAFPLSVQDRYSLVCAPVKYNTESELMAFVDLARARSAFWLLYERDTDSAARDSQSEKYSRRFRHELHAMQSRGSFSILDLDTIRSSLLFSDQTNRNKIRDQFTRAAQEEHEFGYADIGDLLAAAWTAPKTADQLVRYESIHRTITLYLWLHYRFPRTYTAYSLATQMKRHTEKLIDAGLRTIDHVGKMRYARTKKLDRKVLLEKLLQQDATDNVTLGTDPLDTFINDSMEQK